MKHEATINKVFDLMYESWMSEEDKAFIREEMLKRLGCTVEKLDEEIEAGVQNGYKPEFQLELMRRLFKKES